MGFEAKFGIMKIRVKVLVLMICIVPMIGLTQVTDINEIDPKLTDRPWLDLNPAPNGDFQPNEPWLPHNINMLYVMSLWD